MIERGNPLSTVTKVTRQVTKFRDKTLKTNRLGLSWTDKGNKSSLTVKRRSKKHELQANYDRRSVQKLSETIESQQEELHRAQAEERRRRDHQLLHEQLLKQNSEFREAHHKSLNEMEELKKFQSSTFDTSARRRLVEDQDTILELTGKIQELQNEINCMNDSRDFQDAASVRSGHSHVNRRRRTRKGPEPACVQTPRLDRMAHAGWEG